MSDEAPVMRTNLLHVALGLAALEPTIPASFPLQKFWHVAYTGMRKELSVKNQIESLGFEAFLPMSTRRTFKRGKKILINDPLFTRYIFVAFDREKDSWGDILAVRDLECILSNDNIPVTVPSNEIEKLRRLELAGAFDYTKNSLNFKAGDMVEIQEGPFAGLIAKVRCASPKKKVKLLLESLASIEIDPSVVVRV